MKERACMHCKSLDVWKMYVCNLRMQPDARGSDEGWGPYTAEDGCKLKKRNYSYQHLVLWVLLKFIFNPKKYIEFTCQI